MLASKSRISFKESLVILAFLAIILFIPLWVLKFFGQAAWTDVAWRESTDIAMLEWTSAFFHVFLFLLLIEQYKESRRIGFVFLGCGFLCMGIMNFFYSTSTPGSETAMCVRTASLILGGVFFSLSLPVINSTKPTDIPAVTVKFILPALLLTALCLWGAISLEQLIPSILTPSGNVSLFGRLVLILPCLLFFFNALFWLHEYIKEKRRIDFLFSAVILVFAQMTLLMRGASTWGIIWWLLHAVTFVAVLTACIYMLVLSVYRSIVWKLVFSLGLAFSLTVLLASGIMQSFSERQFLKNFQTSLHEQHRRILLESEPNFTFANFAMSTIKRDNDQLSLEEEFATHEQIMHYLEEKSVEWQIFPISLGFTRGQFPASHRVGDAGSMPDETDNGHSLLTEGAENRTPTGLPKWTPFYFDSHSKSWIASMVCPFEKGNVKGTFHVSLDVSRIRSPEILKVQDLTRQGGCVIFNRSNGEILCDYLPDLSFSSDNDTTDASMPDRDTLLRQIAALTIDTDKKGRNFVTPILGNKYFISANYLQAPGWVVVYMTDTRNFPADKQGLGFPFIAIGMITLLVGFVFLLLMLNRQLSKPIVKLLSATKQLEDGNFDVDVNLGDRTEIGTISKAFGHMAWRLKALYSDLESTVKSRTEALDEVKKADSAKAVFFQNVSHELRTPMHGILSFARLGLKLNPSADPEKVSKYFKNINISAERLMRMIDSIMDLAKLESGRMTFHFQNANIILPFLHAEDELKAFIDEKQITLVKKIPEKELKAWVDTDMILRVFRNLLGNAVKMSNPGSTIEIVFESGQGVVRFSVLDEGPGVPDEDIQNIFDKFVQAGEGKKRGGTGLGLSVCREIISAHNGSIRATNRDKGGACFSFEIPVEKDQVKKNDES
ncbi:MAG: HAMP domain-containing protein [Victivallales bacterium]|nr:HAMP domain-containing protein [Victivallales bacterium]